MGQSDATSSFEHIKSTSISSNNPRRKRIVIIGAVVAVVVVIAIILGAVLGVRAHKEAQVYPDYTALTYSLAKEYSGTDFFSEMEYFHTYDPSGGFVHYADPDYAKTYNLTYATDTAAVIRVDTTDTNAMTGRLSARLMTKATWDTGLFVFDVTHSPAGCATWPALWTTDMYNWPTYGEIDIMESVNIATKNQMTLHTTKGCTMNRKRKQTGSTLKTNCYNGTNGNSGCGVDAPTASIGTDFNANGGGVYAMELRAAGIRMWWFPRSSIPSDISSNSTSPNPENWGEAVADFPSTSCDISTHFRNQSIIANIDLCGAWAGQTKVYSATCPGTCEAYVAKNASAFSEAYWQFSSWKVYTAT